MSRLKKSRSLKRVTGGVKTGSKERTKLENKQRKAKQKAANPFKKTRPRSVYQKFLDDNNLVETQHAAKPVKAQEPQRVVKSAPVKAKETYSTVESIAAYEPSETSESSLWDQLEQPKNTDTF